jgi:starvation-inducible DNA-binding protein
MKTIEKQQPSTQDVLINGLNDFLADLQVFYQNLRGFHWNIKGAQFFTLHEKFESYYNETAETVDEVAERILTIGGEPVHAFSDYLAMASLPEIKNVYDGRKAVGHIKDQYEALLAKMKKLQAMAADRNDEGTDTMFSDLIGSTEKKLWMLKAFLS